MKNTALILIDFQNDYFEDFTQATFILNNTLEAATNAAKLLDVFREKSAKIIHVQHESLSKEAPFFLKGSKGSHIHKSVRPHKNEKIIIKNHVNAFLETTLEEELRDSNIQDVIICGAMSHMCVTSAARAASDLKYNCTVVHDACATLPLEFQGKIIEASQVHASSMSALGFAFAKILSTEETLKLI